MPGLRRLSCGALCALLALPAHAVTGARIIVDNNATGGNTTYMASVNDTDQPIVHLGTEYTAMQADPDIAIGDIAARSSPSRGQETDYTRSHPLFVAAGLGFDHTFPNGSSGGYRYQLACSRVGFATICHIAAGARAVTRYRTTCNGKPVQFKVTAWSGRDPGALATTLASLGGALATRPVLWTLQAAYELGGAAWIQWALGPGPIAYKDIVQYAESSIWAPNPANNAARAAAVRAGPYVAALAFLAYFELESAFNTHGALDSEDSYINFSADGNSRVTETLADTPLEQHVVIDDCLEIDAVAQSVPYATKERPSLVPDVNDALVTTVFKRKLPSMIASAAKTCRLSTDDSATRFSGDCQRDSGELVPASLDASGCVNSTGIENQNGTLRCVGERVPKPKGDYLRSCSNIDWNGSTLHAACGTMESLTHPTLNYAGTCRPESTVSYERSGVGSFARGALVCDAPR